MSKKPRVCPLLNGWCPKDQCMFWDQGCLVLEFLADQKKK